MAMGLYGGGDMPFALSPYLVFCPPSSSWGTIPRSPLGLGSPQISQVNFYKKKKKTQKKKRPAKLTSHNNIWIIEIAMKEPVNRIRNCSNNIKRTSEQQQQQKKKEPINHHHSTKITTMKKERTSK